MKMAEQAPLVGEQKRPLPDVSQIDAESARNAVILVSEFDEKAKDENKVVNTLVSLYGYLPGSVVSPGHRMVTGDENEFSMKSRSDVLVTVTRDCADYTRRLIGVLLEMVQNTVTAMSTMYKACSRLGERSYMSAVNTAVIKAHSQLELLSQTDLLFLRNMGAKGMLDGRVLKDLVARVPSKSECSDIVLGDLVYGVELALREKYTLPYVKGTISGQVYMRWEHKEAPLLFTNLSHTMCHFNSVVQCLLNVPALQRHLYNNLEKMKPKSFVAHLGEIAKYHHQARGYALDSEPMYTKLVKEVYSTNPEMKEKDPMSLKHMQDAHETLTRILSTISENDPEQILFKAMSITYTEETICPDCGKREERAFSEDVTIFRVLNLDVPVRKGHRMTIIDTIINADPGYVATVEFDTLNTTFNTDVVVDNTVSHVNLDTNALCEPVTLNITKKVEAMPNMLIVYLDKIDKTVHQTEYRKILPVLVKFDPNSTVIMGHKYQLKCVVNYNNSLDHYTACVRYFKRFLLLNDTETVHYVDEVVTKENVLLFFEMLPK